MANPQTENGYTRIATELAEKFCGYRLSGEEWQVLWVILRKTYGWNKKEDRISYGEISEITGICRRNVYRALYKLINRGVVKKDNTIPVTLSIIKDYSKWKVLSKKTPVVKKDAEVLSKKTLKVLSKKTPTIDNIDTIQKTEDVFNFFLLKTRTKYKLNDARKNMIARRLQEYSVEELKNVVLAFADDDWEGRKDHTDPVYCFGTIRKIDNCEKWLNKRGKAKPKERML